MKLSRPPELPELVILEPALHRDARGLLLETWHLDRYREAGIAGPFVQDVHSRSRLDVLRGLHFQQPRGQGKIVRVTSGRILDIAVDVRLGSPTFARWLGIELSGENLRQLWIPAGFAHGFLVLSDVADVEYRCTDYYVPDASRALAWNDPAIGVAWPTLRPILSHADERAPTLEQLRTSGLLPEYRP